MPPGASRRQQLSFKHQREGIAFRLPSGFTGQLLETLLNRLHLMLWNGFPGIATAPADQQGAFLSLWIPEQITTDESFLPG